MKAGVSLAASMVGRASLAASRAVGSEPDEVATEGPRCKMERVAEDVVALAGRANVK